MSPTVDREAWRDLRGTEIVVPASTSNLGSGFDTLGLALKLYLRVRIEDVDPDGDGRLDFTFDGLALAGENRIEQACRHLALQRGLSIPSARFRVSMDIPMKSGLGSSAAAAVAGFRFVEALHGLIPVEDLLAAACVLEGHPDNAAASLLGSLTGCCQLEDGSVKAWTQRWPEAVKVIVAAPSAQTETAFARRVLPTSYSREDAVFNLQRATWLVRALCQGDLNGIGEALRDRWHQPYRAALVPAWDRISALAHDNLLGTFVSGSGPSVIALATGDVAGVEALITSVYAEAGVAAHVRRVDVHQRDES